MSISGVLFLILVMVPLAGGVVLILFSRRRAPDHPSCGKCGYNVRASIGSVTRCPECGADFAEVGIRPPGGQRSPFMIAAGLLLLVLALSGFGSAVMFQRAAMARAQAVRAAQAQAAARAAQAAQSGTQATSAADEAPVEDQAPVPTDDRRTGAGDPGTP